MSTALQATPWSTVQDKEKFIDHFKRFVEEGMPEALFPRWFYTRLSGCFGHTAHYSKIGFYDAWFSTPGRMVNFLRRTATWPCYGDPTWTYSDAEKVLREWVRAKFPQFANLPDGFTLG